MSKVMSMASSTGVFWSLDDGDGPSEVGFVIIGLGGGTGGRTGRDGGMFTGAGCGFAGGGVLAPSGRSGITIICLPLL